MVEKEPRPLLAELGDALDRAKAQRAETRMSAANWPWPAWKRVLVMAPSHRHFVLWCRGHGDVNPNDRRLKYVSRPEQLRGWSGPALIVGVDDWTQGWRSSEIAHVQEYIRMQVAVEGAHFMEEST